MNIHKLITGQFGHQGDTQWYTVSDIPKNAVKVEKRFIAESERSGSFHGLFGNYEMYNLDNGDVLIDAKEDCMLHHALRENIKNVNMDTYVEDIPKKDHRKSSLPAGKYLVTIQERFNPFEAFSQKVKD